MICAGKLPGFNLSDNVLSWLHFSLSKYADEIEGFAFFLIINGNLGSTVIY